MTDLSSSSRTKIQNIQGEQSQWSTGNIEGEISGMVIDNIHM